ncbi:helix-turn-helix domain-containing protein [Gulosibacter sp. 10]|uniref:helix-turn-helix domain-containing protein n=1 Tax=Gulosibacter sp. 10 TaxID=1255570 RepID=UPI00097F171A|nr:helix-turn-helix domain-containing protein [Gulosibacter sp. 10]SJM65002.1 helix-turn-helix domain protein [Gulosibacter sp. 10]
MRKSVEEAGRVVPIRSARDDRPEPLWRHLLGEELRRRRHERGERLEDTASRAGVSPQYLSEIERGRKEPSSEMIAAVAGALESTLLDLAESVSNRLRADAGAAGASPQTGSARVLALAA